MKYLIFICTFILVHCTTPKFGIQHPMAPEETIQFGQLAGKWSCVSEDLNAEGSWQTSKATWTFKYTLDGFAIEDIWFEKKEDKTNNTSKIGRDFTGINYRIFNPQSGSWQCVWLDNRNNSMSNVWIAEWQNEQIRMHDGSGNWHIIFYNIANDHFDWKYEVKQADGSWKLLSKIVASRVQ